MVTHGNVSGDWNKKQFPFLAVRGHGTSPITQAGPSVSLLHIKPQMWVQRAPRALRGDGVCVHVSVCLLMHQHCIYGTFHPFSQQSDMQPLNRQ